MGIGPAELAGLQRRVVGCYMQDDRKEFVSAKVIRRIAPDGLGPRLLCRYVPFHLQPRSGVEG